MPIVQETDGEIAFIEKVPTGARIFLVLVGLFPLFMAPYELLIRPGWHEFRLFLLISLLISVGAILLGGFFIMVGLFGLNQTLVFVKKSRTIHYSYQSTLMPLRKKTYPFSAIAKISINTHDWTDGPSSYSLQFILQNGQKIETGGFEKRMEAEQSLIMVETLIR